MYAKLSHFQYFQTKIPLFSSLFPFLSDSVPFDSTNIYVNEPHLSCLSIHINRQVLDSIRFLDNGPF